VRARYRESYLQAPNKQDYNEVPKWKTVASNTRNFLSKSSKLFRTIGAFGRDSHSRFGGNRCRVQKFRAVSFRVDGGWFDCVRFPALTELPHGARVWRSKINPKFKKNNAVEHTWFSSCRSCHLAAPCNTPLLLPVRRQNARVVHAQPPRLRRGQGQSIHERQRRPAPAPHAPAGPRQGCRMVVNTRARALTETDPGRALTLPRCCCF